MELSGLRRRRIEKFRDILGLGAGSSVLVRRRDMEGLNKDCLRTGELFDSIR